MFSKAVNIENVHPLQGGQALARQRQRLGQRRVVSGGRRLRSRLRHRRFRGAVGQYGGWCRGGAGRPQLREGFLLERAVEIVIPMGAVEAARKVLGTTDLAAIGELARQSLVTIRHTLETDQPRTTATRLDSPPLVGTLEGAALESSLLPRQQLKLGAPLVACSGRFSEAPRMPPARRSLGVAW